MDRFLFILRNELKQFFSVKKSDRRWELPFAAALASGMPMLIGVYFNHIEYGLISTLGGMTFLYTPNTTPLYHRMITVMCVSSGITACFFIGLISQAYPPSLFFIIAFATIIVTAICRFTSVPPPGPLFFIMALSVATNMKFDILQIPHKTGLIFLGAFLASTISFLYSLHMLRKYPKKLTVPDFDSNFSYVIIDSILIGLFVGLSVLIAEILKLQQYYWVPISCLAVIQGRAFRDIWDKNLQRIMGTAISMAMTYLILLTTPSEWGIAFLVIILTFIVEYFVVRNYAFAAIFITPLTIMLAEAGQYASHAGIANPGMLITARIMDIILGSLIGLLGGYAIHKTNIRSTLLKLIPKKKIPL
ncbi:FUSC family protein [Neisseriaceae bacterium PsAf]|nr:FUSC family protein [Neisseriaceae bacterium PsAf]